MSLRNMAKTGRDVFWSRRGVEEFGGGFLGLFLMKLTEKSEERMARKRENKGKKLDFFDRILDLFD